MNMFKKNGGFTLVELIVVIAILAILAGVAVPVYSGYISKANEAADYTFLDSVKTAAVFATMEKAPAAAVKEIVYKGGATVDVTLETAITGFNGTGLSIAEFVGEDGYTFKSGATSAKWTSSSAKWELTKGSTESGS